MKRIFFILLFCSVASVPATIEAAHDINCEATTCEKTYNIGPEKVYNIRGRCYKDGVYDHIPNSMECKGNNKSVGCEKKTKETTDINKPYIECKCSNPDPFSSHHADITVKC
jgi:hypothetical protein